MPKYQYTEEEVPQFELLKPGDYPFEIVGFETGIANKGKTNGCETVSVKTKFYSDKTFKTPVAQWTERLTFPETSNKELNSFLQGTLNMFVKCTGMAPKPGDELEFTERRCLGLRGIARVSQEKREDNGEMKNRVKIWLTDKEKFPQRVISPIEDDEARPF